MGMSHSGKFPSERTLINYYYGFFQILNA